jgi:microcystin-dependent protein
MPNPQPYVVSYSFSGFQANSPGTPLPAPALDNELANIETTVASLVTSVTDIRRSDGALKNGVVTIDALAPAIALMFDDGPTANATLLANAVASASASADSAAASLAAAEALPQSNPAVLLAGAVLADETVIASAPTTDIGAATTARVRIINNVTITSLGTVPGLLRFVRFTGTLTLTHNATSLALVNGVSRVVQPGDQSVFMSDSSGNWRELDVSGTEAPGMVPLGAVLEWYNDTLPTNGLWAWANGSTVSAALVAPKLLAEWGSRFGGDGVTTMGLPDRRNTVGVGKSTMGGAADRGLLNSISSTLKGVVNAVFGADTETLVTANLPAYTPHGTIANGAITISQNANSQNGGSTTGGGSFPCVGTAAATISASQAASSFTGTAQGGASTPFGIAQPSTTVNYIVRIA